jgi:rhamnogalacturonan endolyase
MSSPVTFSIGSAVSGFPMAIFKTIGPVTINFSLTSSQIGARTLEIGTTLAFAGGSLSRAAGFYNNRSN